MEKLVVMTRKEISRCGLMEQVKNHRIRQMRAAEMLGISDRHFRRLLKTYREEGAEGLCSKKRGKPSNRRTPEEIRQKVIGIIKKSYQGFGPSLISEKLGERDKIKVSNETVRKWMIEEGLWKARKQKKLKIYQRRNRRSREGELIQIDGSPHDWFEGRREKCCLLGFIDDATSKIMHLKFVEVESTKGYLQSFKEYIEKHGKPESCYSDRHSIFRVNQIEEGYKKKGITQLGRALKELDIELICANSPQAKGRIERLFNTLQDRLVKELKLEGISSIEEANEYVKRYIEKHNKKFAIEAESKENAHRKATEELEKVLCYKEERTISKNLEISYGGRIIQLQEEKEVNRLRRAKATVVEKLDGTVHIEYRGRELRYKELAVREHQGRIVDRKGVTLGRRRRIA